MNRSGLSATVLAIILLIGVACAGSRTLIPTEVPNPCDSDQVVPSVEILPPIAVEAVVASGEKMNFSTKTHPIGVSFQWELIGEGDILNPDERIIQYAQPPSVSVKSDVTLSVKVTHPETGCQAIDDIVIQLLPLPTQTPIPTPIPPPTPTATPTGTPPPITPSGFAYELRVKMQDTDENLSSAAISIVINGETVLKGVTGANGVVTISIDSKQVGQSGELIIEAVGFQNYVEVVDLVEGSLPEIVYLERLPPTDKLTVVPLPSCVPPTSLSSPPLAAVAEFNALRTDQSPDIDGCLNEAIWAEAQPLIYAAHPLDNDLTKVAVRLLWDDTYLYAGFDVEDTQVEDSSLENVWDGDSVGVIIDNGGQIREYRYTMLGDAEDRGRLIGDRAGTTINEARLTGATTLNNSDDQDEGYTVEMRIPWEGETPPVAGSAIAADLWSIDHDYNPGKAYDHPDTLFSKISWDGDQNVTTARKSILLATPIPLPSPSAATDPAGPVTISNLKDGETVARSISLVGQYAPDVSDDIWVLVGLLGNRLYPQSPNACAGEPTFKRNGHWEVPIGIGNPDDVGAIFEIVVVTANSEASQLLAQTTQTWCQQNDYPGLTSEELPAGLTEHQRLRVARGDQPTAPHPPISGIELTGQLTITGLNEGDSVPQSFQLNGTANSEVTDPIWILIYSPNGRFYPQSANACDNIHTIRADNLWQVPIFLGGSDDAGKSFDLITILADAQANAFFEEKQQEWCQVNDYPGLLSLELPPGLDEKASIRVIRQ